VIYNEESYLGVPPFYEASISMCMCVYIYIHIYTCPDYGDIYQGIMLKIKDLSIEVWH